MHRALSGQLRQGRCTMWGVESATWAGRGGPSRLCGLRGAHERLQQLGEGALQRCCQCGLVALHYCNAAQQQIPFQNAIDCRAVPAPPQDCHQLRKQLLRRPVFTIIHTHLITRPLGLPFRHKASCESGRLVMVNQVKSRRADQHSWTTNMHRLSHSASVGLLCVSSRVTRAYRV